MSAADLSNPFPGMNPWLEAHWHSLHARLITYSCDAIAEQLPPGLAALTEERVTIENYRDDFKRRLGPDIDVEQPWDGTEPGAPSWTPPRHEENTALLAEAKIAMLEDPVERSIQIVDGSGDLITAVEIISPTNKEFPRGQAAYFDKQRTYRQGGVNLVEIDLVRYGARVLLAPAAYFGSEMEFPYGASVWRGRDPKHAAAYPIGWRDRLPRIPIPLRPDDKEPVLDLQFVLDEAYRKGRYAYLIPYHCKPDRHMPEVQFHWAQSLLVEKGLWRGRPVPP